MKIVKYSTVSDFLINNETLLLKQESFHNLILGLAYDIRDEKIVVKEPLYYSVLDDNNRVLAAALRSSANRPLCITEMNSDAIDRLIEKLSNDNICIKGVVGEENTATFFKNQWTKRQEINSKVVTHLGVFECTEVIFPKIIYGTVIEATIDHKTILMEYITGFQKDCFPEEPISQKGVEGVMNRHLGNRRLFLLLDEKGEIVSMAANTRSTLNGSNISLVYTPPKYRGNGHASSVVAMLTHKLLTDGKKFVSLYTDLTNPTSNSIYQKIGFKKIGQNIHFEFVERILSTI